MVGPCAVAILACALIGAFAPVEQAERARVVEDRLAVAVEVFA
jgi:hypothetical protein